MLIIICDFRVFLFFNFVFVLFNGIKFKIIANQDYFNKNTCRGRHNRIIVLYYKTNCQLNGIILYLMLIYIHIYISPDKHKE